MRNCHDTDVWRRVDKKRRDLETSRTIRPYGRGVEASCAIRSLRRYVETNQLVMRKEAKWLSLIRQSIRDVLLLGFGAWIIWKQVYAATPNPYLAFVWFGCMFPSARSAISTILSVPGQSSESSQPPEQPHSPPSVSGDTGEGKEKLHHALSLIHISEPTRLGMI